jgi:hypothetical protein
MPVGDSPGGPRTGPVALARWRTKNQFQVTDDSGGVAGLSQSSQGPGTVAATVAGSRVRVNGRRTESPRRRRGPEMFAESSSPED